MSVSIVPDITRFIESCAGKMENPVIVIATESHRTNLRQRLQARGREGQLPQSKKGPTFHWTLMTCSRKSWPQLFVT